MDNFKAIIDAARDGQSPVKLHTTDAKELYYAAGEHGVFHVHDTEVGRNTPLRKRGRVVVFDAASFNQVIADNIDAGNIAIYFDRNPEKPSVVAVLNGNGKSGPGWGDFRAEIQFRQTPQWQKWRARDGKMLPQAEFAEFIEDNITDIAEPAGATMLEIASHLEATRTVNFRSGVRLSSGQIQFQHAEDIEAKVSAGLVAVPEQFTLGIAPIFGMPSYSVPARFRYRLSEGKLTLGYKLQRVEDMMGQIVEDVIAKIERGANVSVLDGIPPQ